MQISYCVKRHENERERESRYEFFHPCTSTTFNPINKTKNMIISLKLHESSTISFWEELKKRL